ncbi:MAG: hypothetical protein AABZ57_02555 [Candidatus Margulisiibacteriota bacterium]|mgnify:CR=1 FL=1
MKKLPGFLKKYFWDVDYKKMNINNRKIFILKRMLEYGDEKAVEWMRKNFRKSEIRYVLCNFRGYSSKSANFWSIMLGVNKEKVKCLNKSFLEIQKKFWPY